MKKKTDVNRSVRRLSRTGTYTYYVTLPKEQVEALKWREGQKLVVARTRGGFLVKDWKG